MWCLRFFPTSEFKDLDLNKYTNISSKDCIPEIDLKYLKELCEWHNDHPLASDKAEINTEMLSNYHLKIADFYNIPIGNVKNCCLTFLIKKRMGFIMRNCNLTWD